MALTAPDRLFPTEQKQKDLARALYQSVADLPIISPHGHCDPRWFAENERFPNPAAFMVVPDHYVFRMLVSQGVSMADLGIPQEDGGQVEDDPRKIWQRFADNYYLFRGTPSAMWLDHSFEHVFGLDQVLGPDTAMEIYDHIEAKLAQDAYRPRDMFDRFNIELLATTEGALDDLHWHKGIQESGWGGRVVTTYRPDAVVDPDFEGFAENVAAFGRLTGEDTQSWHGYLAAHRARRAFFKGFGATASVFTLDETVYSRELAPLAGAYPALKLGPPWWFFDSYEGIKRFREATTETCGFYNTAGFNDDTRAFCSIPARHDVSRRSDSAYLATLVATGRLREAEAFEIAPDLAYGLAKTAYKL